MNVSGLQRKWVDSIDPRLDTYFDEFLSKRKVRQSTDDMSLMEKLEVSTEKLVRIKKQMEERNVGLPFEVEPKRKQTKIQFSSGTSPDQAPTGKSSNSTTNSSCSAFARRMASSDLCVDSNEAAKRHKLDVYFTL